MEHPRRLTAYLQWHTLSLPAALTIVAQVVLGLFLGGIGLAVATPLLVVVLVLVRELYVRDFLDDQTDEMTIPTAAAG